MKILENNIELSFDAFCKRFAKEAAILKEKSLDVSFEIDENNIYLLDENNKRVFTNIHAELEYHKRYFYKNSIYKELLAKALGLKKGKEKPRVFDATAGMLKDSLLINSFGLEVIATERNPVPAVLITNALRNTEVENLTFKFQDSTHEVFDCDVAYYDPMYTHKNEKALPRKEMRIFRSVVGEDQDEKETAEFLRSHYSRLVIKRPVKAPYLLEDPKISFKGKSTRYDVYFTL